MPTHFVSGNTASIVRHIQPFHKAIYLGARIISFLQPPP